jgi:hypothetical protein
MKILKLMIIMGVILTSCGTLRGPVLQEQLVEDEILITRKYVGDFIDYRHTGPETYSGYNIIWIKTSMESLYGKFSAYGRKCDFNPGDRLYIKRTYFTPGGVSGYWIYIIENDSSVTYELTEFQHDREVSAATWF